MKVNTGTANTFSLGEMPFYWRIRSTSNLVHDELPSRMNYTFEYIPKLDLIQSLQTNDLWPTLEKMYAQDSNIGFLLEGHTLAESYGSDFSNFLKNFLKLNTVHNILEIGCGGCMLLAELSSLGYNVLGVDPSPVAERAGLDKNIKVVKDFFPSESINDKFDLIFHVDVFEHIPNPVDFLLKQKEFLSSNGSIIINVPDCTETIKAGDISIAQHQHVNSFDVSSLSNVIEEAGLHVGNIVKSGFGGSLYAIATKKKNSFGFSKPNEKNGELFFQKSLKNAQKLKAKVQALKSKGKSIGFYMPLRAIPYMAFMKDFNDFRIFDDIEHWHGGFIDGLDIPIENYNDLRNEPVDHLFIMSFTFGEQLRRKVNSEISSIKVETIKEICC